MAYEIIIESKAQREYRNISPPWSLAIRDHISRLGQNPRPHGVKKLAGTKDGYRIRIGDYRVLFTVDDRNKIVTIYRIRHRKDAYA